MLALVTARARAAGVLDRVVAVHADLGRVEWKGTRELAEEQALALGVPRFIFVARGQGDLLDQIEARGMFPDNANRYCTSDHKRDQVTKVITRLVNDRLDQLGNPRGERVRVLNCMGMRAAESRARSKLNPLELNKRASNGKREVWTWLPLFSWSVEQVWAAVKSSGVRHHPAYDLGMPRLSCCFCVLSSRPALLLAGKHNPELLAEYVRVEKKIGHTFRKGMSIASIADALAAGEEPGPITTWEA